MRRTRSSAILRHDNEPLIVADWPEDIAQFCNLLVTGPGEMVDLRSLTFRLVADEQLQHCGQQQGAAQCAARRARAARPRSGDWNRSYSAAVLSTPPRASSRSIQVNSLS